MLIKEFRIVLPLTVEEYSIGAGFVANESMKNSTNYNHHFEIVKNQPFKDPSVLSDSYPKGQYTFKIYHLESGRPRIFQFLPASLSEMHEHNWNAYPYSANVRTVAYIFGKLTVKVETLLAPDRGTQDNAFKLVEGIVKKRKVAFIDIANDPVPKKDYKPTEDPRKFRSRKTGRGPLIGGNWQKESHHPLMCVYKLVTVQYKGMGVHRAIESHIMKDRARAEFNFHRKLFCWLDWWHGMTSKDIDILYKEYYSLYCLYREQNHGHQSGANMERGRRR